MKNSEFMKLLVSDDKMIEFMSEFGINEYMVDDDDIKVISELRARVSTKVQTSAVAAGLDLDNKLDNYVDILIARAITSSSRSSKFEQLGNMMHTMIVMFNDLTTDILPAEFYSLQKSIQLLADACNTALRSSKTTQLINDVTDDFIVTYNKTRAEEKSIKDFVELIKAVDILANKLGVV
jgi:hypothetical protein